MNQQFLHHFDCFGVWAGWMGQLDRLQLSKLEAYLAACRFWGAANDAQILWDPFHS